MKKTTLYSMVLMLIITAPDAGAFVDRRLGWWELKLKDLQADKKAITQVAGLNAYLGGLIDREIAVASGMLAVLEKRAKRDSSLAQKREVVDRDQLKERVVRESMPILALSYANYLAVNYGSTATLDIAKKAVRERVMSMAAKKRITENIEHLAPVLADQISPRDWKLLSFELLASRMQSGMQSFFSVSLDSIHACVRARIGSRSVTTSELRAAIETTAAEQCALYDIEKNLPDPAAALERAGSWQLLSHRIERRLDCIQRISGLMQETGMDTEMKKISGAIRNLRAFEDAYFVALYNRSMTDPSRVSARQGNRTPAFAWPDFSPLDESYGVIDSLRKTWTAKISGAGFDRTLMAKQIIKETAAKTSTVARAIEKIEHLATAGATDELKRLKAAYAGHLRLIHRYRDRSIRFVELQAWAQNPEPGILVKSFDARLQRNVEYLGLINTLMKSLPELSRCTGPDLCKRAESTMRRIHGIHHILVDSVVPERRFMQTLSPGDHERLRAVRRQMAESVQSSKMDIAEYGNRYIQSRREFAAQDTKSQRRLDGSIADHEIEMMHAMLKDQAAEFDRLSYSRGAIARYILAVEEMQKAAAGNGSAALDQAIRDGSFIPQLKDFDMNRITDELKARRFLKKRINGTAARLSMLVKIYHSKGMQKKDAGIEGSLQRIKLLVNKGMEIPVFKWKIDDENLARIDRKVIQALAAIRNKKTWKHGTSDSVEKNSQRFRVSGTRLSLAFPPGWMEERPTARETENGIMRAFRSFDRNATIYVSRIEAPDMSPKDAAEQWVSRMRNVPLTVRWGKKDSTDYYQTVSSDAKKNVMESYTIKKGPVIYIIAAITSRDRYRFLKAKVESIFNSAAF